MKEQIGLSIRPFPFQKKRNTNDSLVGYPKTMKDRAIINKGVQRRVFCITIACLLIGLAVRLAYCIKYPVQPRDTFLYESIILDWNEQGEIPERNSAYQFSLWLLKIPHDYFHCEIIKGGVIVNMIIGLLIVFFAVQIIWRHTHNEYATAFTGIVTATHPLLIKFSCVFLRENSYLLFALLSLDYLYCYYKKNMAIHLLLSGVFISLTFLCRLEGMELYVIAICISLFSCATKKISYKQALFHCVLLLITSVIILVSICNIEGFKMIRYETLRSKFYEEQQ